MSCAALLPWIGRRSTSRISGAALSSSLHSLDSRHPLLGRPSRPLLFPPLGNEVWRGFRDGFRLSSRRYLTSYTTPADTNLGGRVTDRIVREDRRIYFVPTLLPAPHVRGHRGSIPVVDGRACHSGGRWPGLRSARDGRGGQPGVGVSPHGRRAPATVVDRSRDTISMRARLPHLPLLAGLPAVDRCTVTEGQRAGRRAGQMAGRGEGQFAF